MNKPMEAVVEHPWIALTCAVLGLALVAVATVVSHQHRVGVGEDTDPVRLAGLALVSATPGPAPEPTRTAGRPAPGQPGGQPVAYHHAASAPATRSSTRDRLLKDARRYGVKEPDVALSAAREAGIPFYVGAAFLMQESGGGANVFGHDASIYSGAGKVTKDKYLRYRAQRKSTGKMQGVGPMQLTWYRFQDRADRIGGAWKPYSNMLVGFRHLAHLRAAHGNWHDAARDYNGSGPAAVAYAGQVVHRISSARAAIGTPPTRA